MNEENELVKERHKKLESLKALGVDPFGGAFAKEGFIAPLLGSFQENKKVRTAGRISAMRFMGKSVFADLKDETDKVQLYLKKDHLSEIDGKVFDLLDIGDILGVEGEFFKTKTGQISIRVEKLWILAKCLRPMPEKWHGLKDVELRYRQRYLDLISNDSTKDIFKKRSLIIRSIRRHLDDHGYLEVETPMMHPIPGGAAGKPFKTHHEALNLELFLRVAPELYLKRLLVGGFDRVYEINKSFRNEGISTRHNPEFTMLEVYTAYHDVNDVMALCQELIQKCAQEVFGSLQLSCRGAINRARTDEEGVLDLSHWERVSFAELMKEKFGIVPDDPTQEWIKKLRQKGINVEGKDLSRTQIINIVADLIDPVGSGKAGAAQSPVFVTDYFAELSPLARCSKKDPRLADRFELYIAGMEIANGYSEQNDPITQKNRFLEELQEMGRHGEKGSLDEDYIHALEHGMPPAGGLGIGIDRLVMILTGQPSIREVILFPQMKKEA